MDQLVRSLETAPIVDRGEYQYFVHPITDGIPLVEPALLEDVAAGVEAVVDLDEVDKLLTAEAMGIHLTTAVSMHTGVPFVIARKRSYGFEGEVAVHQETGYGGSELYINGIEPGDTVLLLDDVISTGNTLAALSSAVEECGATIEDIVVVFDRITDDDRPELPVPPKALVTLDVVDNRVEILETVSI